MNKSKLNEFKQQVDKVIPLIENEYNINPKPMLELILKRYRKAIETIQKTPPESLNEGMFKISGGVRAYLDVSSDYMNPVLIEMDKAESMLDELFV